jgi:hypothetical protein
MDFKDISLNKFQLQVLRMVAKGKGKPKWGTHDVAILVVPIEGEEETSAMRTLEQLKLQGMVVQTFLISSKMSKWDINELGEQVLTKYTDVELF